MVSVDQSVFIQIVNFIFIIWALNVLLYRPIRGMLKKRAETVEGLNQEIGGYKAEAQSKEEALEAGMARAKAEGMKKKDALTEEAEQEQKQIIGEINEKAQKELEELRKGIAGNMAKAREELSKEVDDYARMIGEKILGRAVA
ncbi:MAG: ATP synthase F0 subunit B [Desulfatibacillaceae bacterium]